MPNVDGFQVLEYFKNNNLFKKIPVSIITGDDSKEAIEKAFTYPIVDMLNKPFNEHDVKVIVEKTINYGK
ncbi:MAG: response regulator, partial [Bacilli bacterium]